MNPEALKNLKDQLIAIEPDIQVMQQAGGGNTRAITALHGVLVQLLHLISAASAPSAPAPAADAAPKEIMQPAGVGAIGQTQVVPVNP